MRAWQKFRPYMDFIQRSSSAFSTYFLELLGTFLSVSQTKGASFLGVFAVGSLMVGAVRLRLAPEGKLKNITNVNIWGENEEITPEIVISALTFGVGVVQVGRTGMFIEISRLFWPYCICRL